MKEPPGMRARISIEIEGVRGALVIADKMREVAEHAGAVILGVNIVSPAPPISMPADAATLAAILAELKVHTKLFGTALEVETSPASFVPVGVAPESWPPFPIIP